MRISDWSSDVCSSDLGEPEQDFAFAHARLPTRPDATSHPWREADGGSVARRAAPLSSRVAVERVGTVAFGAAGPGFVSARRGSGRTRTRTRLVGFFGTALAARPPLRRAVRRSRRRFVARQDRGFTGQDT